MSSQPSNEPSAPDPSATLPENYELASRMVTLMYQESNTTLGVLLTLADATPPADISPPALKAYKDLIKREIHRHQDFVQHLIYTQLGVEDQKFLPTYHPIRPDNDKS